MAPASTIVVLLASLLHARFASAAAANSLCRAVLPSASIATRGGTALAISTLLSLSLSLKFASAYAAYRHGRHLTCAEALGGASRPSACSVSPAVPHLTIVSIACGEDMRRGGEQGMAPRAPTF